LLILAIIAVVSYLLGSIPFGYLLVRVFRGEDVRASGSGNIGATNVARKSPLLGAITLILDALKGSAAVAIAIFLTGPEILAWSQSNLPWYPDHPWSPMPPAVATRAATAALFAVAGHIFPIWLKFRGGKGVATGLGAFVLIAPASVLATAIVFVAVVAIWRYVSLGSVLAVACFPFIVYLMHGYDKSRPVLALISATSLLIIARHHENIRRLLAGAENRLGARSA